jgi:hypothetical protein
MLCKFCIIIIKYMINSSAFISYSGFPFFVDAFYLYVPMSMYVYFLIANSRIFAICKIWLKMGHHRKCPSHGHDGISLFYYISTEYFFILLYKYWAFLYSTISVLSISLFYYISTEYFFILLYSLFYYISTEYFFILLYSLFYYISTKHFFILLYQYWVFLYSTI